MKKHSDGNALFLILIAVALFAALSYAITSSSRGGGGIEREQQMIDTALAQQCTAYVQHGEMRLAMLQGCTAATLSYELPSGHNANENAPADKSCHLFDPAGAGLTPCGIYAQIPDLPGVTIGSIAYGDTTTAAPFSGGGGLFRCSTFSGHNPLYGVCSAMEFSTDNGHSFQAMENICFAKDSEEYTARADGMTTFGNMLCNNSCGDAMFHSIIATSGGWTGEGYYYGDDESVTSYSGGCYVHLLPFSDTNRLGCLCWAS